MGNTCKSDRENDNQNEVYLLTSHFNPVKSQNRLKLARNFLNQFRLPYFNNLKVIVVECAIQNEGFELNPKDYPGIQIIQVRSNSIMWFKENLLNIALNRVPIQGKYIIWSDADITFVIKELNSFSLKIKEALKQYAVVQLFEYAQDLDNVGGVLGEFESLGSYFVKNKEINRSKYSQSYPHPGYCWAARKEVLQQGFFENNIIGNGDQHMAFAFLGRSQESYPLQIGSLPSIQQSLSEWEKFVVKRTKKEIGFVNQQILHNWHGNKSDRGYNTRWQILIDLNFNHKVDLIRNKDGVLEFSDSGQRFQEVFKAYFKDRKEDNNNAEKLNYPKVVKSQNNQQSNGKQQSMDSRNKKQKSDNNNNQNLQYNQNNNDYDNFQNNQQNDDDNQDNHHHHHHHHHHHDHNNNHHHHDHNNHHHNHDNNNNNHHHDHNNHQDNNNNNYDNHNDFGHHHSDNNHDNNVFY